MWRGKILFYVGIPIGELVDMIAKWSEKELAESLKPFFQKWRPHGSQTRRAYGWDYAFRRPLSYHSTLVYRWKALNTSWKKLLKKPCVKTSKLESQKIGGYGLSESLLQSDRVWARGGSDECENPIIMFPWFIARMRLTIMNRIRWKWYVRYRIGEESGEIGRASCRERVCQYV